MTKNINILIVEDNGDLYESYSDACEDLNNNEIRFELHREVTAEGAKMALLSNNFDGAIIDLNLDEEPVGTASGNFVLQEILGQHRFPVLVVSGNLGNLDEDIRQESSSFLKFYNRDEKPDVELFQELLSIYETGITNILGGRGEIEKRIGEVFWKHLAEDFSVWSSDSDNSEKTLLRYTLSHLSEYLDIPDGEHQFYHEAELYIKPPIREHIATGDIIEINEENFIVLSPACDIAVRNVENNIPSINAKTIVLVPLIQILRADFLAHGIILEADNGSKREKALDEIIKGKREKYFFLPEYGSLPATVADFQNIESCTMAEYTDGLRKATVAGVFLKEIQSRFSSYLARPGQPDLNKRQLLSSYKSRLSPAQ